MTVEVLYRVPDGLLPYIDCWLVQEPSLLGLEIVHAMNAQMDAGMAIFLRHGYLYVYVCRLTPWRAEIHFYNTGTAFGMVTSFKAITEYALRLFPKIEGRTHHPNMLALAKRCGFKQEAVYEKSFRLPDGSLVNEYGYGICRQY